MTKLDEVALTLPDNSIADGQGIRLFFDWINERHAIYLRRQDGMPWPWTDDEILRTYKFTNVFRELDKGTIWLRENWLEPFAMHPKLYFNIAMYRQFNWPFTMDMVGYAVGQEEYDNVWCGWGNNVYDNIRGGAPSAWNPTAMTNMVEYWQKLGHKVFTGAHMIRGASKDANNTQWTSKAQYMFHKVLDPVWNADEPGWQAMSLQDAFNWWMQFDGFGPFLSYEVVTDMRHTRYLKDAPDIMTWANAGPGAIRGINRICGLPLRAKKSQMFYNEVMQRLLAVAPIYLEGYVPALEMRDVEHSLCEWDKYERVRLGQGKPRSRYYHEL